MPASASFWAARDVGAKPFHAVALPLRAFAHRRERRRLAGAGDAFQRHDLIAIRQDPIHRPALVLAQMGRGLLDGLARHAGGERRIGLLARAHGLDGVALELDHLPGGERAPRHARPRLHADEFTGGHALGDVVLDGLDGHVPHRPCERIPHQGPFVDDGLALKIPVRGVRHGGARRDLRHVVFAAARAVSRRPARRGRADGRGPPRARDGGAASPRASRRPSLRGSGAPRSGRRLLRSAGPSRGSPESAGGGDWTPRGRPASSRESPAVPLVPRSIS